MRIARSLSMALAALSLALTPCTGHAQAGYRRIIREDTEQRQSHVPLPPAPGDSRDTEQLFKDRLGQSELLSKLKNVVKDIGALKDPQELLRQLKNAGIDPKSPEFKKLMENELAKLTPEQKKVIQELIRRDLPPIKPPGNGETPPSSDPPPDIKPPPVEGNGPTPNTTPTPQSPENTATAAEEARRREVYQWLFEKLQGMEGLGKTLSNSPAVRDMVRDLGQIAMQAAANARNAGNGDGWLNKDWPLLRNLNLSRLANLPAPSGSVSLPSPPSLHVPSLGFGGGAWELVLWPVGLMLAALVIWKILRLPVPFRARPGADAWRLGPWPVRPEAVATREELVRGFEYLSLLRLGREAMAWNHHAVADRLGGADAERQRAATELAAVYEKARYAPDDEVLDAAALAAARRDLCLLAGVVVA
jgi:hypothetical protein